jgi:ComF family protein
MISVDKIVGLIAPHMCISCGKEGSLLCKSCIEEYFQPSLSRCAGCFEISKDYRVCRKCRYWLPLQSVYVANIYEGVYEQLLKALKFEYRRQAVESISAMLNETIYGLPKDVVVCPIPTAPSRVRERGFDHAKLIAKELSAKSGIKYLNALGRHTNVRQLGSGRQKRLKQMESEFYILRTDLAGKNVLIIDDVMTTGATLAGASKVLKEAGVKSVYGAVFARKV